MVAVLFSSNLCLGDLCSDMVLFASLLSKLWTCLWCIAGAVTFNGLRDWMKWGNVCTLRVCSRPHRLWHTVVLNCACLHTRVGGATSRIGWYPSVDSPDSVRRTWRECVWYGSLQKPVAACGRMQAWMSVVSQVSQPLWSVKRYNVLALSPLHVSVPLYLWCHFSVFLTLQ